MSLEQTLNRIESAIESAQGLHFSRPGIFTNAVVKCSDITKLLKDPTPDEASLYKVTKPKGYRIRKLQFGKEELVDDKLDQDARPERVDGRSIYIERSFTQDDDPAVERKRLVVQVPELREPQASLDVRAIYSDPLSSSPTKRKQEPSNFTFPQYDSTEEVSDLCTMAADLIRRYPNLVENQVNILNKVQKYKHDHKVMSKELDELTTSIEEQKRQLDLRNISYSDITSPMRSGRREVGSPVRRPAESDEELDLDDVIEQEEREIQALELQLNERQGE